MAAAERKASPAASRARKQRGAAQRRKQRMTAHKAVRLAVQIAFFILAPGAFSSAMNGIHSIAADLGAVQPVEATSFVVILVATLGYTILLGRFFCGYACAFGTMGDVLYLAGTPLRKLLHLEGRRIVGRPAAVLRWGKYAVLAVICLWCFNGFWSTVAPHDPWTVFGRAVELQFDGLDVLGAVLLLAIMVFQMLFERSFCRFLCPMGAVFSLMPVPPFSQYGRRVRRCGPRWCNRCIDACPAVIYPDKGGVTAGECFACGRCADACPIGNVNLIVRMEQAVQQAEAEDAIPAAKAEPTRTDDGKAESNGATGEAAESEKTTVKAAGADFGVRDTAAAVRAGSAVAANTVGASSSGDFGVLEAAAQKPVAGAEKPDKLDEMTATKPTRPKRALKPQVKWRFKGSGAAWTLTRAGVLLAMLWLIGATRFLPDVATVLPWLPWLA